MGTIEKVSLDLSSKLGMKLEKSDEEIAVLNYGLFMIIHTGIGILATIIVGILTGMIIEVMVISITSAFLKRYTGGVHASTPERCLTIGIILSLVLAFIVKNVIIEFDIEIIRILIGATLIFTYFILYKYCPVASKNKPLKNESVRKKLRKKAFVLINIYTCIIVILYLLYINLNINTLKIILISCLIGIQLQAIMLTNIGDKFIKLVDSSLNALKFN